MRRILKPVIWAGLAFFLLNISVSFFVLFFDLRARFPNLDYSKARFGKASWYSEKDKGVRELTSSGEKFDDSKLTCAAWNYPFDTELLIINPVNRRWVVCRVNDRGPAKRLGRAVDLSKATFRKIAKLKHGVIRVTVIPLPKKK